MATWYTPAEVTQVWASAPAGAELAELVESAREQCIVFATNRPAAEWVEPAGGIPFSWRRAHLLQVKATWNAEQASPTDALGGESQTVRVYPMGQTIRDMLVPRRSTPGVG